MLRYEREYINDECYKGLSSKEVLIELNVPFDKIKDFDEDCLAYGEEMVCDLLLDNLIEDNNIQDIFSLDKDYNLIEYLFKDCNFTDKGLEDITFSLGYELDEVEK